MSTTSDISHRPPITFFRYTYNDIHNVIKHAVPTIAEFKPDILIAIGGGGFFPARILRTFLKDPQKDDNVPLFAIGLRLYGSHPGDIHAKIVRTQWIGPDIVKNLLGRRVLIVDEVDDTRMTMCYAVSELQGDVERELQTLPEDQREAARTKFAVFVVNNKHKKKLAELPKDVPYIEGEATGDKWLIYPWEAENIEEHDRLALLDKVSKA